MTPRSCPGCGLPEERSTDSRGNSLVNLNPITGECLACLSKHAGAKPKPMEPEPRDVRKLQTGDTD